MNKLSVSIIIFSLLAVGFSNINAQNKVDDKGRKQGQWIKKDNKGKIVEQGTFKDDYPIDTFYYYNNKGKIELVNIFSDKGKTTVSQFLYPDGKTKAKGKYIDKKKEGVWEYFNEKGIKIKEENYANNLKEGISKQWDNDGKNIIRATTYTQGIENGEYFQSMYKDGYYTCNYKDGKFNGEYNQFYPDKKIRKKGLYKDGKKDGEWVVFDQSGNVVQKIYYKNDIMDYDLIIFSVKEGIREIPQDNIAVIRKAGKQTQIVLFNGDRINSFNITDNIVRLTDENRFLRINESAEIYVNIRALSGINPDGSVKLNIPLDAVLMADKDGIQAVNTLFRED